MDSTLLSTGDGDDDGADDDDDDDDNDGDENDDDDDENDNYDDDDYGVDGVYDDHHDNGRNWCMTNMSTQPLSTSVWAPMD